MENCDEFASLSSSQLSQDRQQAKRHAALLKSVVNVMKQDVIVILKMLQGDDFEPANAFHGDVENSEDRLAFESCTQLLGDCEGVVSDAVDSAGDFGNDLEKRAQDVVDLCRPSAASYSRTVSDAICSQRNFSAICRLFVDSAL